MPRTVFIANHDPGLAGSIGNLFAGRGVQALITTSESGLLGDEVPADVVLAIVDPEFQAVRIEHLIRSLRERHPGLPIFVIGDVGSKEVLFRCLEEGALTVLPKPVDVVHLYQLAERFLFGDAVPPPRPAPPLPPRPPGYLARPWNPPSDLARPMG